jgi:hypothetical protein
VKTEIALDRQAKGAERAAITLEGLIEKASQILDLAIAEKQFSAAVAALQRLVRSQACALSAGRLAGLASLNCSALILGIKKNHDIPRTSGMAS